MNAQVLVAVLVGVAATIHDLRSREIADWIPATALIAGLGWQVGQHGWSGILYSLGGAITGFAVFLAFYMLGGMGGGDIKLMAGFGSLLGAGRLLEAALWTAGVGGLLALAALGWRSGIRMIRPQQAAVVVGSDADSIPYAPAIAMGVWLSLVPKS
jgi:prepilin peptidase CpaA